MDKTITIRIPRDLHDAVSVAREQHGMTLTGYVRQALRDALQGARRKYVSPGTEPPFQEVLSHLELHEEVLLLVQSHDSSDKVFYLGCVSQHSTFYVSIASGQERAVILRKNIVGWITGSNVREQAVVLFEAGWAPAFREAWLEACFHVASVENVDAPAPDDLD